MKNKFFLFCKLCMLAFVIPLHAQTLSPTAISSSGGFYTSSTAMLSFTIAEMTMVQTFTSAGNILTQGFQQPEDFTVGISENPATVSGEFLLFPNPTNGIFTLNYESSRIGEKTVNIYNLVGQIVLTKALAQSLGTNTATFDISSFRQGIYMLELNTVNEKSEKETGYHKINLVY